MEKEEVKKSPYEKGEVTGKPLELKIEQDTDELTKDDKEVFTLMDVSGGIDVNAIVLEAAQAVEGRLSKTLVNQISDLIKPLKQSRIEYLEQELNVVNFIMMEIQETYLGMFLLKRIHKKIRLDAEKKAQKDKDEVFRGTMDVSNLDYPIIKEGKPDGQEN